MAYCVRADVLAFLPSGGLPNAAREATADATANDFEIDQHGLIDDQPVRFTVSTGGSVPTGVAVSTTYYAIVSTTSRFQVAATAGGAAINLTTAGENFQVWTELPWDAWMDEGAADVDGIIAAACGEHTVPVIAPYPRILVLANAELAAARGIIATAGAEIDLGLKLDAISKRLTPWAKSLPFRGEARSNHSPANLAITASAGASDPRGWSGADATRIP
jgi:hypothetical protein